MPGDGWKSPFRLQAWRPRADERHVHTPRGLLATLGVTLSLVAAAACVLVFTSTLVAVKGWPGLSEQPDNGPVALAPVDRQAGVGGPTDAEDAPLVLGAPAATSTPVASVGLAPAAGDDVAASDGSAPSARMERGAGRVEQTPVSDDDDTTSNPITIGPIPAAPGDSAPTTIPALGPAVTPAPTTTESAPDTGSAPQPSQRRVTVSSPVTDDDASEAPRQQGYAPEQRQSRRAFAPQPVPSTEDEGGEEPSKEGETPTDEGEREFAPDAPSTDGERGLAPDEGSEQPSRGGEPTKPEIGEPGTDNTQPGHDGEAPAGTPKPEGKPKPETQPEHAPKSEHAPKPDVQADPCGPVAESKPEPQPQPPVETQPAPEQPQPEPQPQPATDVAPEPAPEQAPAPLS
jgi:hypothetical protein